MGITDALYMVLDHTSPITRNKPSSHASFKGGVPSECKIILLLTKVPDVLSLWVNQTAKVDAELENSLIC